MIEQGSTSTEEAKCLLLTYEMKRQIDFYVSKSIMLVLVEWYSTLIQMAPPVFSAVTMVELDISLCP